MERNLRSFLELLSHYVDYDFEATDWETVAVAVEKTDDKQADGWYLYPLIGAAHGVEVRFARSVGSEELSVTVNGPMTTELELRADTLLSAFATC
ncbi:hypothetical protein [Streptomyces sp. NBC_01443]|uniref:hypothetical protein n=1 Tax=Streptomyces sp. NBC_01443 TaxID=2903868 RepID=UPI00225036AB|nr:hypothetical protein [Streptomyces sp. NBC_01443]MCX4632945.1 hypothetical protein [Streptomyces sp. NBC_01443]